MMGPKVVGALSSCSPEFLVPLFLAEESEIDNLIVLITSFREDDLRTVTKAYEYTQETQFSLPLPYIVRQPEGLYKQKCISIRVSSFNDLLKVVAKWGTRCAVIIRSLGDKELSRNVRENVGKLLKNISISHNSLISPEEAFYILTTSIYSLTLKERSPIVKLLHRPYSFMRFKGSTSGSQAENSGFIHLLMKILESGPTLHASFKEKGFVKITLQENEYLIRNVTAISENAFALLSTRGDEFKIQVNDSSMSLFSRDNGQWVSQEGDLAVYGILTLVRVAAFGTIYHVPWYAKFRGRSKYLEQMRCLSAYEVVSPFSPQDRHRASYLVGGGFRLLPSGSSLFDYRSGRVKRFINLMLSPSQPGDDSWWLIPLIHECASGRSDSAKKLYRRARRVAIAIINLYCQTLARGRGLQEPNEGTTQFSFEKSLRTFFIHLSLLKLLRKYEHYQSGIFPRRRFVKQLAEEGWVKGGEFDTKYFFESIENNLRCTRFMRADLFSETVNLSNEAIEWSKNWQSQTESVKRIFCGVTFPDLGQGNWYYHAILVKKMERIAANFVIAIWTLTETVLSANLWILFLLLGSEKLPEAASDIMNRRWRKTLAGNILFERK